MHIFRRHLNYANVTATIALVFAMSGGALAAKHYLINSTKQINPKVLKKLKGKAGKTGATGPAGIAGAPGKEGPQGKEGKEGKEGPLLNTLPSGKTEVGAFSGRGTSQFQDIQISFPIALASAPIATVVPVGTTTSSCTGTPAAPTAAAGHVCIYEKTNTTGNTGVPVDPATATSNAAGRFGLFVFLQGTTGSDNVDYGSWAVTAP